MLRFCLIGAGRAGLVHANNIARRIKNAELAAICDANPDALSQVGRDYGVSKLYSGFKEAAADPEIDAVVIVTPTFLHRNIACQAAENGKHVFLEKPMAITVAECKEINSAVDKAGVRLQIGFMRRFDEGFLNARSLVESGEMGRVIAVKSIGRGPGLPPPWIYDIRKSNGILAEVNSHDFDSLRWFSGSEIARVYAEAGNFKCPEALNGYPEFYDNATVNLRFASGALGTIDGTCPAHYGYDARVEILCEKGVVFVGSARKQGVTRVDVDGRVIGDSVKSWRFLFKDAYLAEMEHFIGCVLNGKEPSVNGYDGMKAVEAVVAANQSILSGKPVEIR